MIHLVLMTLFLFFFVYIYISNEIPSEYIIMQMKCDLNKQLFLCLWEEF